MSEARRRRVLIVLAGAADVPGDDTPLAHAERAGLDAMARRGRAGVIDVRPTTPWNGFAELLGIGGDAVSLGAAEALGAGIDVPDGATAWRADFVTVDDRGLRDPVAGKVTEPEAGLLLEAARAALPGVTLHRLEGHRNLAVAAGPAEFAPSPWEMVGRRPLAGTVEGGRLREWVRATTAALVPHDVNSVRLDLLENPANALWFHGGGERAATGLASPAGRGVVVGRGRVTAGLARAIGWDAAVVDGDDEALAAEALARIQSADLVVVRTESPLRATPRGAEARRDAITAADARLVRPILGALEEGDAFTLAVASDSVFGGGSGALVRRAVPAVVLRSGDAGEGGRFTESECERSGFHWTSGAAFAAELGATGAPRPAH